ncbi:zinc ion binding protein [Arthroderma uncinatum]|uniref:zinc ion binding protein n=1 Tax=Arthroderma uncinatum TaxID=74035 RepID=UPI00144A78F6|nr:zinc ion binding protein [Arthroderma uncinatum]KAF3483982.1 zinc ion binding protein [Arthroderma uncinatum]
MRELDPLVSEYQHEKHRPREAEALMTLRKIASMVKPIMRQRMWRVGTLCEFYPSTPNLLGLNVNYGEKIFHGPHDQKFHALWNQLRDEHEQLLSRGYTGEGFLSDGKRLGGSRIPMDEARRVARAAAEKRRVLTVGSGKKLGGAPVLPGTDMRRVLADAAERRTVVTKGCASGTTEGDRLADEATRNGFRTKAEMDDANERAIMEAYIDLIQQEEKEQYGNSYTPPSSSNPAGPRSQPQYPTSSSSTALPQIFSSGPPPSDLTFGSSTLDKNDQEPWTCSMCTFVNRPLFLSCEVCSTERGQRTNAPPPPSKSNPKPTPANGFTRPVAASSSARDSRMKPRKSAIKAIIDLEKNERPPSKRSLGWVCHCCGAFMESQWWTCSACGTMKLSD